MKTIIKILLICSILIIGTLQAQEQYSKEQIQKHLETIFKYEITYEELLPYKLSWFLRYLPFGEKVDLYINFSSSIQEQKEKILIIKDVVKRFENIIKVKITVKVGKPPVKFEQKNNKLVMINKDKIDLGEFIFFDFATRDEIFEYLQKGFWRKTIFKHKSLDNHPKYFNFLEKQKKITIGGRVFNKNTFRHVHLIEFNFKNNSIQFDRQIAKELFLSLLARRNIVKSSDHIKPSIFNNTGNDISKKELSKFDWILFDEFYNNKDLKLHMLYKTEVIPILTEAIYNRVNTKDQK